MTPESIRLPASGGLELRLLRWSGEGVPMLLIHGFGNEAHIWDDFAPTVAPHYQLYALDLRGHGESDWDPEARYEYENHVADLEVVVDGLGFDRFVLVGHSLGGRVAMRYAGRHPQRIAGLVVVDSGPELDRRGIARIHLDVSEHRDPSFASIAEYENYLAHAYTAATPSAVKRMALHGLKQREDGRYILKMDIGLRDWGTAGAAGPEDLAKELAAHEEESTHALWDALATIPCPTLVVRGAASDILSADVADQMVDDVLQNGSLAVVPQAGHSVMTDNPEGFGEAVRGFVLGK